MGQTRWLMIAQAAVQVPKPLVAVLIFWLTIIFIGWGDLCAAQRHRRGHLVRLCAVGFVRDLFDHRDVHALRGSHSGFQRPTPRRSRASRPVAH